MAVNWILPVRATQAILSVVVLGLMAYGTSSPPYYLASQSNNAAQYRHGGQRTGANPHPWRSTTSSSRRPGQSSPSSLSSSPRFPSSLTSRRNLVCDGRCWA
jgi:hypothetical protein